MHPKALPRLAAACIAACAFLPACAPPPPVPSPLFTPNPPYPPTPVDPSRAAPENSPADARPPESLSDIDLSTPTSPTAPQSQPRNPRSSTSLPGNYPLATPTTKPNRVVSPFAPYHEIDVEGFRSGQLARDPSNGKIFRVP